MITQNDINLLLQATKEIYFCVDVLNSDFRKLDCIEGNLISDNISISADSNLRRTYNCEMVVSDDRFLIGKDKFIWFTRYISPHIGIMSQRTRTVTWYCLGIFLFNEQTFHYNPTTKQLSLSCVDMMALLDDTRKGQLDAYERKIERGADARNVIIHLLNTIGISRYYIEFNKNNSIVSTYEIPYDKTYSAGTTAFQIIKDIVDLYAGTQMYFDIDGTFTIKAIPTKENEIKVLTDDIIQKILIDEQTSISFSSIYNHIIIWGKVNSPDYYTQQVTLSGSTYCASIVETNLDENTNEKVTVPYTKYENFDVFAIRIPQTNQTHAYLSINSLNAIPIVDDNGKAISPGYLEANTDCIFRYRQDTNDFLFLGQYQCYGEAYLTNNTNDKNKYAVTNDKSDFSIEVIGERLKTLTGNEYDNIYTNSLACQRARYELYNSTNRQDTLTLTTIAIPWLDVNQIIQFTSNITHETNDWIITNISCDYSNFTMTINTSRYYPTYI